MIREKMPEGACVVVSEAVMSSIRRTCYEAGRAGREMYTVRVGRRLARCAECVNWRTLAPENVQDWCPVVRKCTLPTDWCCWGARKGDNDGR